MPSNQEPTKKFEPRPAKNSQDSATPTERPYQKLNPAEMKSFLEEWKEDQDREEAAKPKPNHPGTSRTDASAKPKQKMKMPTNAEAKAYADACAQETLEAAKKRPEGYIPPY